MRPSTFYFFLLAHEFFFFELSIGLYIGNAVVPTLSQASLSRADDYAAQSPVASINPRDGIYITVLTTTSKTATTSKSTATSKSTTTSRATTTEKPTATSHLTTIDSTLSTLVIKTETHTTTKQTANTVSESSPSSTSAPQSTSSSNPNAAPTHRSSSTAMFAAGCFMAVFFSVAFIFLIARLQWKRISPILAVVKTQWTRVSWALEGCRRWLTETAVSVTAGMKKTTKQSTKRITRLFGFDYRAKSLPPIPSTTSERQPLSSEPPFLPSPFPMSSFVPVPSLEPSPWPQPLEIRRYPFHYRPNLRREWRSFHPPLEQQQPVELPAVELPASPVPLQLLQERGLGVIQRADTMGNSYNSLDEPQIQQAQLQRLHRIQNMVHVVQPPALRQYRPYRKPLQRFAS